MSFNLKTFTLCNKRELLHKLKYVNLTIFIKNLIIIIKIG